MRIAEIEVGGYVPVIIWLNGSFGVGKTTMAERLKRGRKDAAIYDPELIGSFLSRILPEKKDDFQDYELWRSLNYHILRHLSKGHKTIIVPMTITVPQYREAIIGRLQGDGIEVKEIILTASRETLKNRLDQRGNSTEWSYRQIDKCVSAFASDGERQKIDTDGRDIDEVATQILNSLDRI